MKRNAFGTWLGAALLTLAALSPACSDRGKADNAVPPVVAVLEPIPAPPGLLAQITIPLPEATWKDARLAVGGPALFLPQSIGGFMTTVLGLPITVAAEFDGNLPALGAMIDAPERGQPYMAIGVHVKVGERLVDQLTKGEAARFTARVDPASGVTSLEPKGTVKGAAAMGVLGNYLLIGRELADLTAAGPFIARTLSKSPAAAKEDIAIDIPDAALIGPVRASLERLRDALKGSSAAAVPLLPLDRISAKVLDIVPDLSRARVTIDIDGPSLRLRIAGAPKAGNGPASVALSEMTAGDLAPLRTLPEDTLVGLLDRGSASSRVSDATTYAKLFASSMSGKLDEEDSKAIEAALRSIAEARGPFLAGGLSFGSTGPLAYVQGAVSDEEKLGKGLKDLWALSKRPSIKAWLKQEGLSIKVGKAVIEDVSGDVQRVTITRVDVGDAEDGKGVKGAKAAVGKGAKESEKPKAGGAAGAKDAKDAQSAKDVQSAKDAKDLKGPKDAKAGLEGDLPTSIDLFYSIRKEGLFAAAGYGAKEGFAGFLSGAGAGAGAGAVKRGFGDGPEIKAAIDALGGDVAFAVVIDPLRLIASRAGKPGAASSTPVVLALGRDGGAGGSPQELWVRLDVAVAAIQELVKHRGALPF